MTSKKAVAISLIERLDRLLPRLVDRRMQIDDRLVFVADLQNIFIDDRRHIVGGRLYRRRYGIFCLGVVVQ